MISRSCRRVFQRGTLTDSVLTVTSAKTAFPILVHAVLVSRCASCGGGAANLPVLILQSLTRLSPVLLIPSLSILLPGTI